MVVVSLTGPARGVGDRVYGQYPIVIPEPDIVAVVTAWNMLPDRPALDGREVLERLLAAVRDR